jgi:hypothetical protein
MRTSILTLVAAAALAVPARADWQSMNGQPVPALSGKAWLNTDKEEPTAASMRGTVYLLEFFATW